MFEALKGGAKKRGVQRVLVAIPQVGGGAARVAKRVDVEVPQAFGVAHELGESSGRVGIIYIPLLPESCHRQMIFYYEQHQLAGGGGNAKAFEQRCGQPDTTFGMSADALGLADVVQQKG